MLNINTLSGYEGVGKSTVINHCQKKENFVVIPETARLIMPLENSVLEDSRDDLSYKSFISYLTNIHFMLSNNMNLKVVSDRNLVDSLTYLKLYSKEQQIDIVKTGNFIEDFLEQYQRDTFYDHVILIEHPKNDLFIEQNILSDKERKYGKNVQQYKRDALIWENIYLELVEYLMTRHLAKSFHIVKSYAENKDCIIKEILSIIK